MGLEVDRRRNGARVRAAVASAMLRLMDMAASFTAHGRRQVAAR
jgi:hypothetical protein